MKRILNHLSILIILLITLFGCSNEVPKEFEMNQLTRVDAIVFTGEDSANEKIIAEEEDIKTLREVFARIKWEENVKAEMARKEDVKATLFFTFDKNMPERLFEYFIWFSQGNASATIIDREKSAKGTLDKEDAKTLKDIMMNN